MHNDVLAKIKGGSLEAPNMRIQTLLLPLFLDLVTPPPPPRPTVDPMLLQAQDHTIS